MIERVVSVGKLVEGESNSLGSSVYRGRGIRVKEEVGSRNGIFNSIEVCDYSHEYYRAVSVWHLILFTDILVH